MEFNLSNKIQDKCPACGVGTNSPCHCGCHWEYHTSLEIKDVKQFIKELKKSIDESADKTDIWDNERWDKFRKILRKDIDKLAGDELI